MVCTSISASLIGFPPLVTLRPHSVTPSGGPCLLSAVHTVSHAACAADTRHASHMLQ